MAAIWWVWQWFFIVIIECIVLEDSNDSDDDSNLSVDFNQIKKYELVWMQVLDAFRLKFPFISKTVRDRH